MSPTKLDQDTPAEESTSVQSPAGQRYLLSRYMSSADEAERIPGEDDVPPTPHPTSDALQQKAIAGETLLGETVIRSGYLMKRSTGVRKNWKKRWFVLRSRGLAVYKDEKVRESFSLVDYADCQL